MLAARIVRWGRGSWLSKIDLKRAYRQFAIDPFDYPLLGIKWDGEWFVDVRLPFGLKWAAAVCQRATEAIAFMAEKEFQAEVLPFIDDMSTGDASRRTAQVKYERLLALVDELGLQVAEEKCSGPAQVMTWIGVTFDTRNMNMYIEVSKVQECQELCLFWLEQGNISEKNLQRLVGKLFHIISLVPAARRYLNRLLDLLSAAHGGGTVSITEEARMDLRWMATFLPSFSGAAMITDDRIDEEAAVDACLTGAGGICAIGAYSFAFSQAVVDCKFSITVKVN